MVVPPGREERGNECSWQAGTGFCAHLHCQAFPLQPPPAWRVVPVHADWGLVSLERRDGVSEGLLL